MMLNISQMFIIYALSVDKYAKLMAFYDLRYDSEY